MTAGGTVPRGTLLCLYTAILFAGFSYDIFRVVDRENYHTELTRHHYLGYDSFLVLDRLHLTEQGKASALAPLTEKYYSQFGLQGVVLGLVLKATSCAAVPLAYAAANVGALLTALLLAAFFADIQRRFGPWAGGTGVLLTACSPILALMVPSLYWCTYLLFAPFVCTWLLHDWLQARRAGPWLRAALVFGFVFLKCLCGYEYVTTVILSPLPALWYFRGACQQTMRSFLLQSAGVVVAGVAAFALALAVHAGQLTYVVGVNGIEVIRERAVSRTVRERGGEGPTLPIRKSLRRLPERVAYPVSCFLEYFQLSAVATPGYLQQYRRPVPIRHFLTFTLLAGLIAVVGRRRIPDPVRWLAGAVLLAFLTAVSWNALAINHMSIHFHLNRIIFFVPFLPLCYALLGHTLDLTLERLRLLQWTARWQLPTVIGIILIGAVCEVNYRAVEYARRSEARQLVERHHRMPNTVLPPLVCHVDGVQEVHGFPAPEHDFGSEMNRSRLVQERGERGKLVVVSGWIAAGPTAGPPQVLACRGTQFLPAELRYAPRPDAVKAVGPHQGATGFVLVIRCLEPDDPRDIQVFAVSRGAVYELPVPHGSTVAHQR